MRLGIIEKNPYGMAMQRKSSSISGARGECPMSKNLTSNFRRPRSSKLLRLERLEERSMLAAPQVFEPRGAGGGGALFAPSFSPFNANDLYVASDMGQIFHTTNLGQSWETLTFLEIQGNTGANVQFTNDPNVRYSLDYTSLLSNAVTPSKSTDGGLTWTRLAGDPTGGSAVSMFADPADQNRVIVTDFRRLYFSNNGGVSFGAAKYTTSDMTAGLHIAGVFFDGTNIYVGTNKGLLVSSNGGSSFSIASIGGMAADEAMVSFAGAKEAGAVRLFAVTMNSGDVYAGVPGSDYYGYRGIYSLNVGDANWTLRTTGIASTAKPHFVALARNEFDVAYVAGSSDSGTPTIYKTTNGGASWASVLTTANNLNVATGWSGSGGDRGWTYGENAMGFAVSPTDLNRLVITDFGFAHVSTNGGTSWTQMYVNPADQNPAGVNTPKGKNYRSSGLDNTTSWGITWVTPTKLIGSNSDIQGVRSDDAGQSWSFNYTGHTDNSMYRSVVHPVTGVVYAGTSSVHDIYQSTRLADDTLNPGTGKVLFSINQGSEWKTMHDFGNPVVWVALDPTNANRMYASVIDSNNAIGGIYVSNNIQNGETSTWTKLATPPRTEGHPFNIQVLNDGTLVATYSGRRNAGGAFTASSGVFVSTDGGASWVDRSHTGMYYWTKDIIVDPHDSTQNTWYVGVFSGFGGPPNGLGGLYRSTNRGVSWTRINSLDRVTSLTISPTNGNEAYLTTEEDGLWHTQNLNAATPTFTQLAQYPFRQPERVFFNPNNSNEIWVTSFGNGMRVGYTNAASTADYDRNGSINQADHTFWKQHFGETNGIGLQADGNGSGVVDTADYVFWRKAVPGAGAGSVASDAQSIGESQAVSESVSSVVSQTTASDEVGSGGPQVRRIGGLAASWELSRVHSPERAVFQSPLRRSALVDSILSEQHLRLSRVRDYWHDEADQLHAFVDVELDRFDARARGSRFAFGSAIAEHMHAESIADEADYALSSLVWK